MTVLITGDVTDATRYADSRPWQAWSPVYRQGSSGEVVSIRPQPVRVAAGKFVGEFEPGILVLQSPDGDRWTVTVPDHNANLWELIATAVAFPPDTSAAGTAVVRAAVPATASSAGVAGQIAWDASHLYVCTATNTWVRAALATW